MRVPALLGLATLCLAILGLVACSGASKTSASAPESVDRMSKAQVEAIVKEYLLREPEVMIEVFAELEKRESEAKTARAEGAWEELISNREDPVIGPKNAPITIVEFTDYNCAYCKLAAPWVMKQLDDRRGDVRLIVKESAIRGEASELAARAALAAHKQGKYREMHFALMKAPANALTEESIEQIARTVGLDLPRWRKDMNSKAVAQRVDESVGAFSEAGLEGTPGFFINGKVIFGFHEPSLDAMIEAARKEVASGG